MLCVLNSIALKKMLLNIFFSTFTILANHPPASDTVSPALEVRLATVKPAAPKTLEPKPARPVKSTFYPAEESSETITPAYPAQPEPARRKASRFTHLKI